MKIALISLFLAVLKESDAAILPMTVVQTSGCDPDPDMCAEMFDKDKQGFEKSACYLDDNMVEQTKEPASCALICNKRATGYNSLECDFYCKDKQLYGVMCLTTTSISITINSFTGQLKSLTAMHAKGSTSGLLEGDPDIHVTTALAVSAGVSFTIAAISIACNVHQRQAMIKMKKWKGQKLKEDKLLDRTAESARQLRNSSSSTHSVDFQAQISAANFVLCYSHIK